MSYIYTIRQSYLMSYVLCLKSYVLCLTCVVEKGLTVLVSRRLALVSTTLAALAVPDARRSLAVSLTSFVSCLALSEAWSIFHIPKL